MIKDELDFGNSQFFSTKKSTAQYGRRKQDFNFTKFFGTKGNKSLILNSQTFL